ncbi:MAG: hypothetical protein GTN80_04985 [Nitrososphaeria archaeon]|nr:hypothetical protein [Nitrososphaeria archaeon]NIQ32981.1 hypothetical protein [Nitrososphaeria archaeon]
MSVEALCEKLKEAIIDCDTELAKETAEEILKTDINILDVIERYLAPAMETVGDRFERMDYYLSDLMLAADAMKTATDILTSRLGKARLEEMLSKRLGTVVIGTVKGDIHDIGKNLVALLLEVNGFDVHDLGKEVLPTEFIDKAEEVKADVVALSALMTNTLPNQAEVIDFMREKGLREKYKIIVGGAVTSQHWSDEIGADGWAPDASSAVALTKRVIGIDKRSHL